MNTNEIKKIYIREYFKIDPQNYLNTVILKYEYQYCL